MYFYNMKTLRPTSGTIVVYDYGITTMVTTMVAAADLKVFISF